MRSEAFIIVACIITLLTLSVRKWRDEPKIQIKGSGTHTWKLAIETESCNEIFAIRDDGYLETHGRCFDEIRQWCQLHRDDEWVKNCVPELERAGLLEPEEQNP